MRKKLFFISLAIAAAVAWQVAAQEPQARDATAVAPASAPPDGTAAAASGPADAVAGETTAPATAAEAIPSAPDGNERHQAQTPQMADGAALYDRFCLACHGLYGDGKGPAAPWLWPRPRDFTRGEYKWRSTTTGEPPTDDDIARAIRVGVPGTSMHGFGQTLSETQIATLSEYLKEFAKDSFAAPGTPVVIGEAPAVTDELIAEGKATYSTLGCVACHGESGTGDGPAASALRDADGNPYPPYDLTTLPVRRPDGNSLAGIYTSLLTGLSGTAMPAYAGQASERQLWAVAAYVDSIRYQGVVGDSQTWPRQTANPTAVHPTADKIDREQKLVDGGYWPGHGLPEETAIFGTTVGLQGKPSAALTPAQSSLSSKQCARCHNKQVREWTSTLHAKAASPGLMGQFPGANARFVEDCQRCHNPLAEQLPNIRTEPWQPGGKQPTYVKNPRFDSALRHEGINCASCHVRNHQRLGPPLTPESKLLDLPSYPLTEMRIYERSDFCLACHQLPPKFALQGKPLLNTYREWLEGPYMRRGIQCQHCHMPNREHTWKGIHDPDTFRQGYRIEAITGRSQSSGAVSVRARMHNVGAGHYLPTTPTPAAWISIELVDENGDAIRGAYAEKRIGRHLEFSRGFVEVEDTRIPPGQNLELAAAWKDGQVDEATAAKITVRVEPDEYYERFYKTLLAGNRTAESRAQLEEALRRAQKSHYIASETLVPITQ